MIKVKDGYAKLIGTTYAGSASRVLLSNGGDHVLGNASGNIPLNNGTVNTNLNADMLDRYHASYGNNKPWGTIPVITTNGWMDIGKHLEFHYDNTTGSDYSTALMCTGNHGNVVNLPSATGTLALTTDNVASATKLSTARKLWGLNFDGTADVSGDMTGVGTVNSIFTITKGSGNAKLNVTSISADKDYLSLYVSSNTSTNTNTRPLVLQYDYGNVGIGVIAPIAKLHVSGSTYIDKRLAIGTLLNTYDSSRACLDLITKDAYPSDLFLGADGARYWGITGRNASDNLPKGLGFYDVLNSTYRMVITSLGDIGIGTSTPSHKLHVSGNVAASQIYANRTGSSTSGGISLYSNSDPMTYGIAFRGTGTYEKHGYITSDWATYLTMNDQDGRGWIFRRGSTNVFSINTSGNTYANGIIDASYFYSRVATGTQPYACASTTLNTNLNADLLDDKHADAFIQTNDQMIKGTYGVLPGYHQENGWHRIATINASDSKGYGSFILYITGSWNWKRNTLAIIHINTMYTTAKLTLVSGVVGFITKIRLVNVSANLYYVDVNVDYTDSSSSTSDTPGTAHFYFLGNGQITTNTTALKITETVTTTDEITLVDGGSAYNIHDAGNKTAITLKYSSEGFTSNPSYLAAWNGYQITYVAPSYVTVGGASNADTLDGIHASGLLTSISSSETTNLSVVVGGTTKSITNLHAHYLDSLGNKNASDLSSTYPKGLSVAGIYNAGWPFYYGAAITACGNGGYFQIAGQWNSSVTSSSDCDYPTEMYIRGRRDSYDVWQTWTRVLTNKNYADELDARYYTESEADSRFVNVTGDTMTGNLIISSGGELRLKAHSSASTDPGDIVFQNSSGTEIGRIYKPADVDAFYVRFSSSDSAKILIHSGNYTTYTVKKDGTGASGTWGINISGSADKLDGKHASDFKYVNVSNYSYTPNIAFYDGGSASTNYYKLSITNVNNVWTMLYVEMSIKENYRDGNYGKIIVHVNKNNGNTISEFTVHTLGQLSSSVKAYANNNSSSFDIYIAGNWSWPTLNVDRITFGDSSTSVAEKNITLTKVTALPSSYSTASVITGIHSGNYNSYSPKLNGTGATGTWGINITGTANKATNDVDGKAFKTTYLRKVTVENNTTNDFNTFENMTLTGRGDPTTGASLSNAPWTGAGPAGGYGVLTYLWSGYGTQMVWGYNSNRIYIRHKSYTNSAATWSSTWDSLALSSDLGSYVKKSGDTMTGNLTLNNSSLYFGSNGTGASTTGNETRLPSHIYRNVYDTSGNVYDHYYNTGYTSSTNSYANLRVKNGSTFKTLSFGGDGRFTWDNNTVWHAGNDGSGSGLDADTVDGLHVSKAGNTKPWGTIVSIGTDGVSEMGKYIDFHFDNTTGSDYSTRLLCSSANNIYLNLPSVSGTLALVHLLDSYVKKSGDWMTGTLNFNDNIGLFGQMAGGTDHWEIKGSGTSDEGRLKIQVHDNATTDAMDFEFVDWSGDVYTPLSMTGLGAAIIAKPTPGSWISGKTEASIKYQNLTAIDSNSFWKFYNMKSASGHVVCYGGLGDSIGFYGYYSSRTANGTDWSFVANTANGNWVATASIYAAHFYENSDKQLKENIQRILNSDNTPQIKEFDWKETGEHSYGLIAQELEEMGYSELVSIKDDGYKTVNYSAALSLIVGKLQVKIRELEKEIENLKNKN